MNMVDLVAKHCLVGKEKRCPKCCEWWPADGEFYGTRPDTGYLRSWCRACESEADAERRARRVKVAA